MGKQMTILEKYVIFEEKDHWKCRFCLHKSNGHPNRIISHLAGIRGKGIKVCPNISSEKKDKIKRELKLTPHSIDIEGFQRRQPREEDDIVNNSGDMENTLSRAVSSDIFPNQERCHNVPDFGIANGEGGSQHDVRIRRQNAVRQEEKGKKKRKRASGFKEVDLFDAIESLNSIKEFLLRLRPRSMDIEEEEDDIMDCLGEDTHSMNIEGWQQIQPGEEDDMVNCLLPPVSSCMRQKLDSTPCSMSAPELLNCAKQVQSGDSTPHSMSALELLNPAKQVQPGDSIPHSISALELLTRAKQIQPGDSTPHTMSPLELLNRAKQVQPEDSILHSMSALELLTRAKQVQSGDSTPHSMSLLEHLSCVKQVQSGDSTPHSMSPLELLSRAKQVQLGDSTPHPMITLELLTRAKQIQPRDDDDIMNRLHNIELLLEIA